MQRLPISRDHPSADHAQRQHERVVISRNELDAAVVVSLADLAKLKEPTAVLSDPIALADIRSADAAYARGDVIGGIGAVRHGMPATPGIHTRDWRTL
jgi:PHD/YefM family antitoxin component YafN of YafNO toxin-antitoxin module